MDALDITQYSLRLGAQAKAASALMAKAGTATKNKALLRLAVLLRENTGAMQADNAKDLQRAAAAGLAAPRVDRLKLGPEVLETCARGCEQLAAMPEIIGEITGLRQQPSGIRVGQMRVPIGVFGMIFESRPNVTIEAASLSIKSGNACILRGGSEAIESNKALARLVQQALTDSGLPADAVQLVQTTDRAVVGQLITMPQFVDVIIPRGVAPEFLPGMAAIFASKGVQMRGCPESLPLLQSGLGRASTGHASGDGQAAALVLAAQEADWFEEYLAPIISIKVVAGLDEAIAHINRYSSHHTDAIITRDHQHAEAFLREVDSASVMVNASTRFADGFEYGLGAEVGISTDKLHARGPVGLQGLTSLKYVVLGQGEVRV